MEKEENRAKEELILQIEKQIAASLWIQAVAQINEAILLTKLYTLNGESEGEAKIVTGVWVQAIGQTIEALAVTKEISANDPAFNSQLQRIIIISDAIQSAGAAVEAAGGTQLLAQFEGSFLP
jgi:hypothetical protein